MNQESRPILTAGEAREDLRQLVGLLAESHPDPFAAAGGMIPFYRRANKVMQAISEGGMTGVELLRLLRPLVAAVRDGHTTIFDPHAPDQIVDARAMGTNGFAQPCLWIDWEAVDEQLVVASVYDVQLTGLIGAKLHSIEDVSFMALCDRMRRIRGDDNTYNNLVHLSEALGHPSLLFDLLESAVSDSLVISFIDGQGQKRQEAIALALKPRGDRLTAGSSIELESLGASRIGWQSIGTDRRATLLRIGPMMWYREAFEVWRHYGYHHNLTHHLDRLLSDLGVDPLPEDLDARIDLVPSASEMFVGLLSDMERTGSTTLIVDLRESTGGNSTIVQILQFALFGLAAMVEHDRGYQVRRLSPLYFENNRNQPREQASDLAGGYDFSEEREWLSRRKDSRDLSREGVRLQIIDDAAASPTFAGLLESYRSNLERDLDLYVLTSARTYSAGFDMAAMLFKHGATVVGVPSSQAGNCFIDTLRYTLDHSGLQGRISYKWSLLFPEDDETGRLLRPHHELTYEHYAALNFDPNAALRLVLDL